MNSNQPHKLYKYFLLNAQKVVPVLQVNTLVSCNIVQYRHHLSSRVKILWFDLAFFFISSVE